jgi:AraC-like DNA-binding protein
MPGKNEPLIVSEVWGRMQKEWLWVYRGRPARSDAWSPEILVPAGVFFVERGHVDIEVGGRSIEVPAGFAFFSAPGTRRQFLRSDALLLSASLRCSWLDGTPLYRDGLNRAIAAGRIRPLHEATKALFAAVHHSKKMVSYPDALTPVSRTPKEWCRYEAAFLQWFAAFVETMKLLRIRMMAPRDAGERMLARIMACIESSPLQEANPLPAFANGLGLGMRRIDQLLIQQFGMGSRALQERRRLEAARVLLQRGVAPLKAIAAELGFRHASHFTVWFKRHHGISPSSFRESGYHGGA